MNELINELVDFIKEDQRYLNFQDASKQLENKDIQDLLNNYQRVLEDYQYLKQFDSYINNDEKKQELYQIKKQISENETIQKYYQSYYDINDLLNHITKIVFKDISDRLDTTGFEL